MVSAGFALGFSGPGDLEPFAEVVRRGVEVVQSTWVGNGWTTACAGPHVRRRAHAVGDAGVVASGMHQWSSQPWNFCSGSPLGTRFGTSVQKSNTLGSSRA